MSADPAKSLSPALIPEGYLVALKNRTGADLIGIVLSHTGTTYTVRYLDGTDQDTITVSSAVLQPIALFTPPAPNLNTHWLEQQRQVEAPDPAVLERRRRLALGTQLKKRLSELNPTQFHEFAELIT